MTARYFDDFAVGDTFETGSYTFSQDEIVDFARRYDPQPFHLDADAATASVFGGLVASGWHTTAIVMRLIVESRVMEATGIVGNGVDELRWLHPLHPGDTLRVRCSVVEATPSASGKPRGLVRIRNDGFNQRDECVISMIANLIVPQRPG
jgi:acyl dehydratase